MPGDPKECRRHALTFVRLAQSSAYPPARERYAKLVNTWLRLAAELENGQASLDGLNESEPMKANRLEHKKKPGGCGYQGFELRRPQTLGARRQT
jgi:hypothetical protein